MKHFLKSISRYVSPFELTVYIAIVFVLDVMFINRGSWVDSVKELFIFYLPVYLVWNVLIVKRLSGEIVTTVNPPPTEEPQPKTVVTDSGKQFKEINHAVKLSDEIVGRYMDRDIPAWIEKPDGTRLFFEGTIRKTAKGEWDPNSLVGGANIIEPGLVYRPKQDAVDK